MKTDLLENIRMQFKRLMFANETCTYTTTDGKNIIVLGSDVAPGVEIYELDATNNQIPLANGEIVLSDGRKVIVKDNKVETITAPSAEEMPIEPTTVEQMADIAPEMPEMSPEIESPDDVAEDTDTQKRIADLEMKIEELYNMLQGNMAKTADMIKCNMEMSEQIKVLSAEPATTPHKQTKVFASTKTSENSTTIENIRNIINQKNSFNIGNL